MTSLFYLIAFFWTFPLYSQSDNKVEISTTDTKIDTLYIQDVNNLLSVYHYITHHFYEFSLSDSVDALNYKPNGYASFGLGFNYKWIGLGFSYHLPLNEDDEKFGKTEEFDLQAHFYGKKFVCDLNFQNYKGFYISNPESYIVGFDKTGTYPQRNDIEASNIGVGFTYYFNHRKFSYKASFSQTEWQKKTAGSFLLGNFVNLNSISARDGGVIPAILEDRFDTILNFNKATSLNLGCSVGFIYSWVIHKNFYITMSGLPGLSAQNINLHSNLYGSIEYTIPAFRFQYRGATGYNSDNFYWGISYVSDSYVVGSNVAKLTYTYGQLNLFLGKRFDLQRKEKKIPAPVIN